MPEIKENNLTNAGIPTPHLIGALLIPVLGLATFIGVYGYMDASAAPAKSQAAAAAVTTHAFDALELTAKSAIVVDLTTGQTLYEKNADAQLPLASMTKVTTILAAAEVLDPEQVITIPYDTSPKGSAMRLAKGEKWKVSDVITFTLVASSNEGANILADEADAALHAKYPQSPDDGIRGATLWRMNDLVRSLGLTHTYFLNATGLDESTTQAGAYGSSRDMARIMAYAASTSQGIFAGTARDGLLLTGESGNTTSAYNTNEALGAIPGLIMGKTGYTDLAGGNLAVVFDVGLAHPVVAVVMNSTYEGRFTDMKRLVAAARDAVAGK